MTKLNPYDIQPHPLVRNGVDGDGKNGADRVEGNEYEGLGIRLDGYV